MRGTVFLTGLEIGIETVATLMGFLLTIDTQLDIEVLSP